MPSGSWTNTDEQLMEAEVLSRPPGTSYECYLKAMKSRPVQSICSIHYEPRHVWDCNYKILELKLLVLIRLGLPFAVVKRLQNGWSQ